MLVVALLFAKSGVALFTNVYKKLFAQSDSGSAMHFSRYTSNWLQKSALSVASRRCWGGGGGHIYLGKQTI